jgi:Anti-sigma-K factor rskA
MTATTHEAYEQLAVGHALNALEPEDEERFLAHLAACAACERAVDEHLETLSHLAYAAEAPEPPPELLAGIRAGVLASGRPVAFPDSASADEVAPLRLAAQRAGGSGSPRPAVGGLRRRLPMLAAAAAVVVALVGLAGWNASLRNDQVTRNAQSDRLASAVSTLVGSGSRSVPLQDADHHVLAVAVIKGRAVSLVTNGVPVTDTKARYILWREDARGDLHSVGAFDVSNPGVDVVRDLPLPVDTAEVRYLLVTREPRGKGLPAQPSSRPMAFGHVL